MKKENNNHIVADRKDKEKRWINRTEKKAERRRRYLLKHKKDLIDEFGSDVYNRFVGGGRMDRDIEFKVLMKLRSLSD